MKNTDTAQKKGYDAGKKYQGFKRRIAVDTQGLPHAVHITTVNIVDRGGALEMFALHEDALSNVENLLRCKVEIAKRSELHTFKVIPKRWVVGYGKIAKESLIPAYI